MKAKTDTIELSPNIGIVIQVPENTRHKIDPYEEGVFHYFNNPFDSTFIVIHCGAMVNLPFTNITTHIICSKFELGKDVRILRGYHDTEKQASKVRLYFREENYFKYGITVLYENVDESRLSFYDGLFDNIKVYRTDAK